LGLEALEDRQLLSVTPSQIWAAYGVNQVYQNGLNGAGQTIAIIDAYAYPQVASDLQRFDQEHGVPAPPRLKIVGQNGGAPPSQGDPAGPGRNNWEFETALDVEWAHAIAPGASLLLVEANSSSLGDLFAATNFARQAPGVSVVSMSFGDSLGEQASDTQYDKYLATPSGHTGVTFVAASGDHGVVSYPSSSPSVLAVGGTQFSTSPPLAGASNGEIGWAGSGGGYSAIESEPAYQRSVQGTGSRSTPDVAYDAGTPFAIYDTWGAYGIYGDNQEVGTSAGAPQWAALIALADQSRAQRGLGTLDGPTQTLPLLYLLSSSAFNDITGGNTKYHSAMPGYDLVTGLGSPIASQVVTGLSQPVTVANNGTAYLLDNQGTLWWNSSGGTRSHPNLLYSPLVVTEYEPPASDP
jgi:subtilase family serine protease